MVIFTEVKGMEGLNDGKPRRIKNCKVLRVLAAPVTPDLMTAIAIYIVSMVLAGDTVQVFDAAARVENLCQEMICGPRKTRVHSEWAGTALPGTQRPVPPRQPLDPSATVAGAPLATNSLV